mmetsp:Transcript_9837/g.8671  ORF Transcript_9837/g.8671 Transcript_9837/m.8671 type:complete len:124 (-) Transcript_9837:39-410(-)
MKQLQNSFYLTSNLADRNIEFPSSKFRPIQYENLEITDKLEPINLNKTGFDFRLDKPLILKSNRFKKPKPKVSNNPIINKDLFSTEKPNEFLSIRLMSIQVAKMLRSKELQKLSLANHQRRDK